MHITMGNVVIQVRSGTSLFFSSYAGTAFAIGAQVIFISWLAAGYLNLPIVLVAWTQVALLAPNILLFPLGGALADRYKASGIMARACIILATAHAVFFALAISDALSWVTLMIYAAVLGTGNVFIQTTKERLLARYSDQSLHIGVSLASVVQFSAQSLGVAVVAGGDRLGPSGLAGLLTAVCLLSAAMLRSLEEPHQDDNRETSASLWRFLVNGVRRVWANKHVRYLICLVGFNGFMHLGFFMVLLPQLARVTFGEGQAWPYVALQLTFLAGSIAAHLRLALKEPTSQPLQAAIFCVLYAGVIALALSYQTTVFGLFMLLFFWGAVAGVSANVSRVAVLSTMPDTLRGRAMAMYQLALFGAAPCGALLCGYLLSDMSTSMVLRIICYASAALFICFFLFSPNHKKTATDA